MITVITLNPAVDKTFFIDRFAVGGNYRIKNQNIIKSAGGKGFNVSRVVSILGEKISVIGFKAGGTGEWLESQIVGTGVETKLLAVEGESRTTINIIDSLVKSETEIIEKGPEIKSCEMDSFMELLKEFLEKTKVLVCTGGLPEGVPTDIYATFIDMARPYGIKTILDASGDVLKEGVKAKPDLVKPNLRELSEYMGKEMRDMNDILCSCKQIISEGAKIVVTSLGEDGALLVSNDVVYESRPPKIDVINAIGSGDSMIAGFAAGMLRNYSLEEAFKLGMACSVANTQFMEVGLISSALVNKYIGDIQVCKL